MILYIDAFCRRGRPCIQEGAAPYCDPRYPRLLSRAETITVSLREAEFVSDYNPGLAAIIKHGFTSGLVTCDA